MPTTTRLRASSSRPFGGKLTAAARAIIRNGAPALAVALAMWAATAQAQIGQHRNNFAVGVNGGYVMSNITFDPSVSQGWHGGMTGGLSARYTSEKYFSTICSIAAEVNYAKIGWKEDIRDIDDQPVSDPATGVAQAYSRTINYIQIPVFAHLAWGREERGFNFFVNAGPQVGFYLSESTSANFNVNDEIARIHEGSSERSNQIIEQDTMAVENKIDYGIAAGVGVEYSHPKVGHFLLEARYYYGLGDIYGSSKRDFFGASRFGNIVIKASYLFDIAKTKKK